MQGANSAARDRIALSRRAFLAGAAWLLAGPALPRRARADGSAEALEAATESPLIYVSPLKGNGLESRCHGEVWFVREGRDLLVVTDASRWRAACIARGLDRARIWVGDHGVWTRSQGAFRKAPSLDARASLEDDPAARERALAAFGEKYAAEWSKWGPRFRNGLASGERVLIRYTPIS